MWEWDFNAAACHYSEEWGDLVGVETRDIPPVHNWTWWSGRMHVDDMPAVLAMHHKVYTGEILEGEIVFRFHRPDGRWVRLISRGAISRRNDDGTPAIMRGLTMDISGFTSFPPLPPNDGLSSGSGGGSYAMSQGMALPTRVSDGIDDSCRSLTEQRLSSLYRLAQMDQHSENEVLHFAMSNILQLTGSPSGFWYLPDRQNQGG
jgi:hypothetical protein